jgi:hypothetical protein
MNADLTFNSVVFKKSYDLKEESLRRSTTRAINTPDDLIIKSQAYTDTKTKVSGNRYTIRVDRHDLDPDSRKIVSSAYLVVAVPDTVTQAQLDVVVATFKAAVANADLIANVLNNEK